MHHRLAAVLLAVAAVTTPSDAALAQIPGVPTPPLPTGRVGKGTPPKNEEITSHTGCTINDDVMENFLKGLETERSMKAAFAKEAAAVKTSQAYNTCMAEVIHSTEGMAIGEKGVNAMGDDNLSAADKQKAMTAMGVDLAALLVKKCGRQPAEFNSTRSKRMREAEQAGAKTAGMDDEC